MPYLDSTTAADLKAHIDEVSGGLEKRPAMLFLGATHETHTIAEIKTLGGTTLNHWRTSLAYLPQTKSLHYEVAAAYGAERARLSQPNQPLNYLPLVGIAPPPADKRLTRTQVEDLLNSGVTPLEVGSGERVVITRAITTYVRNDQGVADPALLDIGVPCSMDYARAACIARVSSKFPRPLNDNDFKRNLRSELVDVCYRLQDLRVFKDVAEYEDYLIVEDDLQDDTRVNARIPAPVVKGAHIIAERFDLL
jgi:phage tail sheath gpL-like